MSTMNFAAIYSRSSAGSKTDAANYLKKFGHLLKWKEYKENILEFGCADGYITRKILYPYIENHVRKLTGLDISEAMIEYAKNNNDIEKINFQVGNMGDSKVNENMMNKFDHIFSFNCAHFVLDTRSLMERLHKMLKPGGQLFASAITFSPIYETFRQHRRHQIWSKYIPKTNAFADYTSEPDVYIEQILKQAGFKVDACESKMGICIYEAEGLGKTLIMMHPFLKSIPENMQEEYIKEHTASFCEGSVQLDGSSEYGVPIGSVFFAATKEN